MTKDEFLKLDDTGEMWKALKVDSEIRYIAKQEKLVEHFAKKVYEEEVAWQVENFGHYDPDILFDPLPRNPHKRKPVLTDEEAENKKAEFASLKTASEMFDALYNDDEIKAIELSYGLYDIFAAKRKEEDMAWQIEHIGYYDPEHILRL